MVCVFDILRAVRVARFESVSESQPNRVIKCHFQLPPGVSNDYTDPGTSDDQYPQEQRRDDTSSRITQLLVYSLFLMRRETGVLSVKRMIICNGMCSLILKGMTSQCNPSEK